MGFMMSVSVRALSVAIGGSAFQTSTPVFAGEGSGHEALGQHLSEIRTPPQYRHYADIVHPCI